MTILGSIKRQIFSIDRPYKDLRREIWKNANRDIRCLLGEPQIIFDIGANVGQTTTLYLSEFPSTTIYSFEPFPVAFEYLSRIATANHRVKLYPLALSNHVGYETLYISETSVLNSVLPPALEAVRKDGVK